MTGAIENDKVFLSFATVANSCLKNSLIKELEAMIPLPLPLFVSGKASEPLQNLLTLTGLSPVGNILSIIETTQKEWRQPTQHSGNITDRFASRKNEFDPIFMELGYIGPQITTPSLRYDFGYVSGAFILAVRKRFALLKFLWEHQMLFNHLVLGGGKRPRNSFKESLEILNKNDGGLTLRSDWPLLVQGQEPPTEDLIMETVLLQSQLPKMWQEQSFYTVVNTPLRADRPEKPDPSGEDVLQHWLKTSHPKANSRVLLVYSQPQLRHMEIVARRILGQQDIVVDCVGYEAPDEINVSQVLDTIAKVIYEVTRT